jgi:hypothetical protein
MTEHTATRTLVKSPPELWAECSNADALTRHLDGFGDIKITRLEPETAVAWEGEQVRGTVRLEPSGWGTKVTLTAVAEGGGAAVERVAVAPPAVVAVEPVAVEPVVEPEPSEPASAPKRPGFFSRLVAKLVGTAEPEPELVLQDLTAESAAPPAAKPKVMVEPEAAPDPDPDPEPVAEPEVVAEPEPVAQPKPAPSPLAAELADAESALVAALDSLGQAHHRPFSRG